MKNLNPVLIRLPIFFIIMMLTSSMPALSGIIVDHTCMDTDRIPDPYIAAVKKIWFNVLGESHSTAYLKGGDLLEAENNRFQASSVDGSGSVPESYTDTRLRISRLGRGDVNHTTGWPYLHGEEDWFTSAQAIAATKAHIDYCNGNGWTIGILAFGWCWDMTWHHTVFAETVEDWGGRWGGALDYYNGTAIVRQQIWGLFPEDTPNSPYLSLQDYLTATDDYATHCLAQGYPTRVVFTTGPVDGNTTTELGLGRHIKHEAIRDHVAADDNRVLFDYADILCHNSAGAIQLGSWSGHTFPVIHSENMQDLDGTYTEDGDHIGQKGALKIGRGMWWLAARMAGWNGLGVRLRARVWLEGAYGTGQMSTGLRSAGHIPMTSPYPEEPRSVTSVPAEAVDWVLVQLRATADGPAVCSRSAFVGADGRIIRDDGVTGDIALEVPDGEYFVVVRHRNHAAVLSDTAVTLGQTEIADHDFTQDAARSYGVGAVKLLETAVWGMWAGDVNRDGQVTTMDYTAWYNAARLGASGYMDQDINLDGQVTTMDYTMWYNNARVGAASTVP